MACPHRLPSEAAPAHPAIKIDVSPKIHTGLQLKRLHGTSARPRSRSFFKKKSILRLKLSNPRWLYAPCYSTL